MAELNAECIDEPHMSDDAKRGLECPVCYYLLCTPALCITCKNAVCWECLKMSAMCCPMCRSDMRFPLPATRLKAQLNALHVRCPICSIHTLTLPELRTHMRTCVPSAAPPPSKRAHLDTVVDPLDNAAAPDAVAAAAAAPSSSSSSSSTPPALAPAPAPSLTPSGTNPVPATSGLLQGAAGTPDGDTHLLVDFVERMGEGTPLEKVRKGWGLFCVLASDTEDLPADLRAALVKLTPDIRDAEEAGRMLAFFRSYLFCFLRSSEWNADLTLRFMAVKLIELVLDVHPESVRLREAAHDCIMRANTFYSQRLESSAEQLKLDDAFEMGQKHPMDNAVQRMFCRQMSRFALDKRKKERVLSERMLELLLSAMYNHPEDDTLLLSCSSTFQSVLHDAAQRESFLGLSGAAYLIQTVMRNLSRHLLVDITISALISFMDGGAPCAEAIVAQDGVLAMLTVLQVCSEKAAVLRRACKLLAMVSLYPSAFAPKNWVKAPYTSHVELLQLMHRYVGDALLLNEICTIFRNLLREPKCRKPLVDIGVVPAIIQTMYFNPRKQGSQVGLFTIACECLLLLASDGPARRRVLMAGGVPAVLFSVRDPSVSDLQLEDRVGRFLMCFSDGLECKVGHKALAHFLESPPQANSFARILQGCLTLLQTCWISSERTDAEAVFARSLVTDAVVVLGTAASRHPSLEGTFNKKDGWELLMSMRSQLLSDAKSFPSFVQCLAAITSSFPSALDKLGQRKDCAAIIIELLQHANASDDIHHAILRVLWSLLSGPPEVRRALAETNALPLTLASLAEEYARALTLRCQTYLCAALLRLLEAIPAHGALLSNPALTRGLALCAGGKEDALVPAEVREARCALKQHIKHTPAAEEERFQGFVAEWRQKTSKEELDKLRNAIRKELS